MGGLPLALQAGLRPLAQPQHRAHARSRSARQRHARVLRCAHPPGGGGARRWRRQRRGCRPQTLPSGLPPALCFTPCRARALGTAALADLTDVQSLAGETRHCVRASPAAAAPRHCHSALHLHPLPCVPADLGISSELVIMISALFSTLSLAVNYSGSIETEKKRAELQREVRSGAGPAWGGVRRSRAGGQRTWRQRQEVEHGRGSQAESCRALREVFRR